MTRWSMKERISAPPDPMTLVFLRDIEGFTPDQLMSSVLERLGCVSVFEALIFLPEVQAALQVPEDYAQYPAQRWHEIAANYGAYATIASAMMGVINTSELQIKERHPQFVEALEQFWSEAYEISQRPPSGEYQARNPYGTENTGSDFAMDRTEY